VLDVRLPTKAAFAYQWRSCNASGASCSDITGAQNSTYAIPTGAAGQTVRVVVTASNAGGSTSVASAPSGVVVGGDAIPPTFQLSGDLYAAAGAWLKGGTKTVSVAAQDGDTGNHQSGVGRLELDVDGNLYDSVEQACPTGDCDLSHDFALDPATLADGPHTLSVVATDQAGNSSHQDWSLKVDHTAPTLVSSGTLTQVVGSPSEDSYGLAVDSTDPGGVGESSGAEHLRIFVDGEVVASGDQSCDLGACGMSLPFTYTTANYSAGAHVVTIVAVDRAGNVTSKALQLGANYPIPVQKLFDSSTRTAPRPGVEVGAVMAERALVTDWLARATGAVPVYTKPTASSPITFSVQGASAVNSPRFVTPDGAMTSQELFEHYLNPAHPGVYDPVPGPTVVPPDPIGDSCCGGPGGSTVGDQANDIAEAMGLRGNWFSAGAPAIIWNTFVPPADFSVVDRIGSQEVVQTFHSTFTASSAAHCSPNGYSCLADGQSGGPYWLARVDQPPHCGTHCASPAELAAAFAGGSGYKAVFRLACTDYENHPDCVTGDWPALFEGNEYWPTVPPELNHTMETSSTAWNGGMGFLTRNEVYSLASSRPYDPDTDAGLPRTDDSEDPPADEPELEQNLGNSFTWPTPLDGLLNKKLQGREDAVLCKLSGSGTGIPILGTLKVVLIGAATVGCNDLEGNPAPIDWMQVTLQLGLLDSDLAYCQNTDTCTVPLQVVQEREAGKDASWRFLANAQGSEPIDPPQLPFFVEVSKDA
jgi:hypothetical protein